MDAKNAEPALWTPDGLLPGNAQIHVFLPRAPAVSRVVAFVSCREDSIFSCREDSIFSEMPKVSVDGGEIFCRAAHT